MAPKKFETESKRPGRAENNDFVPFRHVFAVGQFCRVVYSAMKTAGVLAFMLFFCNGWAQRSSEFGAAIIRPSHRTHDEPRRACEGSDNALDLQRAQIEIPLGRCIFDRTALDFLILVAYSDDLTWIQEQRPKSIVLGGPDWAHSERFDVEAVGDNPAALSAPDLRRMMQGLLADRFKLKLHRESRETRGYALVTASKEPKLVPAKDKSVTGRDRIKQVAPSLSVIKLSARNVSMTTFAELLSTFGIGPVVDQTKIQGTYDFSLRYGVESVSGAGRKAAPAAIVEENGAPSISKAIREQLGLRLQSQKVNMDYLVIDSVEQPSVN
jgi:uncharacterized protein (TIGR03435 family)